MNEKKPFDDGNEFVQNHLGIPEDAPNNKETKAPLPVRLISYFIFGFIGICFLLLLVAFILSSSN